MAYLKKDMNEEMGIFAIMLAVSYLVGWIAAMVLTHGDFKLHDPLWIVILRIIALPIFCGLLILFGVFKLRKAWRKPEVGRVE